MTSIDADHFDGDAVALQRRLDELGIAQVVLEMQDPQRGRHAGLSERLSANVARQRRYLPGLLHRHQRVNPPWGCDRITKLMRVSSGATQMRENPAEPKPSRADCAIR
jgi:hypothetical protein